MEILVINGSPKGDYSYTLQTALFLQKIMKEIHFSFLNAAKKIFLLEKDFSEAEKLIDEADILLFCYPVYTFIVPSQLHRFIELMKDHYGTEGLQGKYASQLTTSKHFYDVTAHGFIMENCQDMGLRFIKGLSADMDDLTSGKGQDEAIAFGKYLVWCAENGVFEPFPAKIDDAPKHAAVTVPAGKTIPKNGKTIAVVTDLAGDDSQLKSMIGRFTARMSGYEIRLVNIHDFPFRGGCISCFSCAADGICIYKDGFSELLRNEIQTCSAIVIAFSIRDHSMGSVFKTYDDRQFCNGHRTVTMGMPFGYLVSGDYSREKNLQLIIDGRAEVGGNFLAGVATDEFDPDREIDLMAARLDYAIENHYVQPSNFLGVGGMKIFRDLIWLMQGMMKADHRFYRSHHQYDFPQKKWPTMLLMYLVGGMISDPKLKKKIGNKMNEGMIAPYKKVLEQADRQ